MHLQHTLIRQPTTQAKDRSTIGHHLSRTLSIINVDETIGTVSTHLMGLRHPLPLGIQRLCRYMERRVTISTPRQIHTGNRDQVPAANGLRAILPYSLSRLTLL